MREEQKPPVEDVDELIHREEDAGTPPNMPPDSQEDFDKAIRGEDGPSVRIPPANAD